MSATTVPVTFIAADQNGDPVAGATITAALDVTEIDDGFIVPEKVEVVANELGEVVLNLWPNALGVNSSRYRIQARNPDTGRRFLDVLVSVPNSPCNLHQILVQEPFPAIDAAQQALTAAQGALAPVTAQASIATTKAAEALASANASEASRVAAGTSATAAAGSVTAAMAQATLATERATAAAGSAATATGAASDAQTSATAAAGSQSAAAMSAATAATKAAEAAASRDAAASSASAASTSADSAAADRVQTGLDRVATGSDATASGLNAAAAATQAGIAAAKASEAAAGASAATSSATSAAGSSTSAAASAATAATQAATATSQASNAAASAVSAAASFDAFDDRFLGAKAANPTLDNDGQALLVGAMYWNTTESAMRAWSGSEWFDTNELDGRILADQQLLGAVVYATDMALKGLDGITENRGTFGSTDRAELYAYMFGELLDKIGVIGRAISGGTIELQGGTAAIPSLTSATDVATGVFFPANGAMALATAGLERLRITADGRMGLGTNAPSGLLDVADSKLRVRTAQTPASATAAGNQGEWAWDPSHIYVCINTNTWRRAALTSW